MSAQEPIIKKTNRKMIIWMGLFLIGIFYVFFQLDTLEVVTNKKFYHTLFRIFILCVVLAIVFLIVTSISSKNEKVIHIQQKIKDNGFRTMEIVIVSLIVTVVIIEEVGELIDSKQFLQKMNAELIRGTVRWFIGIGRGSLISFIIIKTLKKNQKDQGKKIISGINRNKK